MKVVRITICIFVFISTSYTQDFLGNYNIHGKVTSGLTTQGINGIEVKYIQTNPTSTTSTQTNSAGEYFFNITDVENEYTTIENGIETMTNTGYAALNIQSENNDEAKIIIYNTNGEKVKEYTQKLNIGENQIKIPTNELAQAVYLTTITTNNNITAKKLVKTGEEINWGKTATTKKTSTLKKTTETTYTIEFRDPTETHYPYLIKEWDPQTLTPEQEYNTPLLNKKNLDKQFINPGNGEQVNTTRDLLFYVQGIDVLIYAAYQPRARPLLVHENIEGLPTKYNAQNVKDATLEMLTATNLPVDSTLWKETETYIPDANSSTIGYKFLDSTEMGQNELRLTYIIDNQKQIASLIFEFNKDLIEPEQIGNFVKYAWWWGIVGSNIQAEGYFSYNPRDTLDSIIPGSDENRIYSNLIQYTDRPTMISAENIPENNLAKPTNTLSKKQLEQLATEQNKSYSIAFKHDGSIYKQMIINK